VATQEVGSRRGVLLAWAAVLAWMIVIFYLSSQSSLGGMKWPPIFQALRKSGHIVEYGTLGVLIGRAIVASTSYRGGQLSRALYIRAWWLGVAFATLYGLGDEFHQSFVPRRGAHFEDVIIDGLSAVAALGIWFILRAPTGRRTYSPGRESPERSADLRAETK
jgi:VanZ family protein